jgi:hypothetical protein
MSEFCSVRRYYAVLFVLTWQGTGLPQADDGANASAR